MPNLRPPTKAERAAGLPTSKQEAIKRGLSRFMHPDGEERIIRNYQSKSAPSGRVTKVSERKGSRGGGTGGSRQLNEKLATPDDADKKAFNRAMSKANSQGYDGDHRNEVSRTAEGIRFKEASGRGTRQQYHKNMRDAGISVGNQADNVQPLPPDVNQRVKPAQIRAMDAAIKVAGSESDQIFNSVRRAVRLHGSLLGLAPELVEIVNQQTNGAVDKSINSVVESGKNLVVNGVNGWKDILTTMVAQDVRQKAVNYGQY